MTFAISMLKFDEILSECRECFQTVENDMDFYGIFNFLPNLRFPEISETEKIIIQNHLYDFSIRFLDSLLTYLSIERVKEGLS